jgi:hypothetical protein
LLPVFTTAAAKDIVAENIVSLTHYPPGLLKDMAVLYFCFSVDL